ncbi:acyltransferase domain-containing protein, partial [Actinomadura chokoriensis]
MTTRSVFEDRAVVVGADREELLRGLSAVAQGGVAAGVVQGIAADAGEKVAFVFPGQGSQWAGMALELLESSPVFAERMRECAQALDPWVEWSLLEVLQGGEGAPGLDRVDVVQPVLFAVMVSLAALWRSYGVEPAAVVGHSQGEIAAACVAGALSLQDAAQVVALRSRELAVLAGRGGMVSVSAPVERVRQWLRRWDGRLDVAAINGPGSTVVSGEVPALEELLAECQAEGVRARRVPVDYASHSVQVESLRERLLEVLAGISPRPAAIPFYSTVTAELMDTTGLDADYWYRNLRNTVCFEEAARVVVGAGHGVFVEVSPHPVLTMGVQETLEDLGSDAVVVGSLRRDEGGLGRFLISLGEVFVRGGAVDWEAVFPGRPSAVQLPTYAFQRKRYWLET